MKFVHPEILYALGALAIPIIVHLFNFRKFRKVYFSNVAFLREIQVETQNKSRLRHLLILLMRLLAMAAIILAFAQPYIPLDDTDVRQGDRAVSIYLDNSFSMEAQSGGAPLLEIARNKAIEVVRSYNPTDKFQVITNDFEGRHQRLVSREEAIQLLQEVESSPASRALSEVFARQRDVLHNSNLENLAALHFTDLQSTTADAAKLEPDSSISYRIIPAMADQTANLFIDSVWFATPVRQLEQSEVLIARIVNTANEARNNVPVEFIINGQQKAVATADLIPSGATEVVINFTHTTPGLNQGVVKIDDYPISFDDEYFIGFDVLSEINILGISGSTPSRDAVWAVYGDDAYYRYGAIASGMIDYSQFGRHQLIVLNQLPTLSSGLITELEKTILAGGSLCIIPSAEPDLTSYNDLLMRAGIGTLSARTSADLDVTRIDYDHELFRQAFDRPSERVEMPKVNAWFPLQSAPGSKGIAVMSLRNDMPFLVAGAWGSGRIYLFTVPPDKAFSNLTSHAFFPSTLIRMAVLSAPSQPLAYTIGQDQVIELRNKLITGDETFRLREGRSGFEIIPEHRSTGSNAELFVQYDLNTAGNYTLAKGDDVMSTFGFNYDRRESSTTMTRPEDFLADLFEKGWKNVAVLTGDLQTVGKEALELEEGRKYWWTMIIWALIFLAAEILLIKYWR